MQSVFSYFIFVNFFSNTPSGSLTSNITSHITKPIVTTVNLAPVFFMPQKPYKHWI